MKTNRRLRFTLLFLLASVVLGNGGGRDALANEPPVAEAGLPRYAATDPLLLDGTKSYDPDNSGPLTYTWTQVSGPPLVLTEATTATPTVGGFAQTQQIQECQLQLIVHDGQQASLPDTVKIVIVPSFGPSALKLENDSFDPSKPTIIYFWGGDCINGTAGYPWNAGPAWTNAANVIDLPSGYTPDGSTAKRTYYRYADMIIAYLSAVAPDYRQAIQTIGFSTGFDPALDVALRLNEVYRDARYAVNRVTDLEGGCRALEGGTTLPLPEGVNRLFAGTLGAMDIMGAWSSWVEPVQRFLASAVDGEQCWMDSYYGIVTAPYFEQAPPSDLLWVRCPLDHRSVNHWYRNSLTGSDMNKFNGGAVAGAYWSVVGPGKNLQLTSTPGAYYFLWDGDTEKGAMGFFDQSQYPGRLPEPVTLLDSHHPGLREEDPNGLILTCKTSENAVGYQLLSGSDPYDVAHYTVVADGNSPPAVVAATLPSGDTWWTVKVRDAYGSTIYADPVRVGQPLGVIAWWKLDEAEGDRAEDSAGGSDGTVYGGALWQPAGGKQAGALACDGTDDYVGTGSALDPSAEPFSVFAWVQGGAPGQVILSQEKGANWLMAAVGDGTLATELKDRATKPLKSLTVITDGEWHHVGVALDGTGRMLYVDGVQAAAGTPAVPPGSTRGLYLGAGSTLAPGTFWSGLMDDVRIYNRAVNP